MGLPEWFRFEKTENVLCAIDLCAELALRIEEQHLYVKWLIIATHDMLQGAMVCALSGSANIGALDKKSQKEFLKWHKESLQNPNTEYNTQERLADFKELFRRVRKHTLGCEGSAVFSEQVKDDLYYLHDELRNNFVHCNIDFWSIERASLSRVLTVAYDATEFLMMRPKVHLDNIQLERMKSGLERIRSQIRTWRNPN